MNSHLKELRSRPIPQLSKQRKLKKGYRNIPIAKTHNSDEALVDLKAFGIEYSSMHHNAIFAPYFTKVDNAPETLAARTSIGKALQQANIRLQEFGYEIFAYDAFRPHEIQQQYYSTISPNAFKKYRLTSESVKELWACPDEGSGPPPHSTGAAIDLTLRQVVSKETLFMGSLPEDPDTISYPDYFESIDISKGSGKMSAFEARSNRRVLYWALNDAGLITNPTEWWHSSIGDQMWAAITGKPQAYYDAYPPHPIDNA